MLFLTSRTYKLYLWEVFYYINQITRYKSWQECLTSTGFDAKLLRLEIKLLNIYSARTQFCKVIRKNSIIDRKTGILWEGTFEYIDPNVRIVSILTTPTSTPAYGTQNAESDKIILSMLTGVLKPKQLTL